MGVKWSISVPTASPARAVKKACTHACEQDSKIRAVTRKVSSKQQAPTMAQPPCQASAEEMAAHDRQAWRTLDMADIQQRIQERAEHTQALTNGSRDVALDYTSRERSTDLKAFVETSLAVAGFRTSSQS